MNLSPSVLPFTIGIATFFAGSASARQWVSNDCKFKVEAELVGFDGLVVEIQKSDGNKAKVPVDRLSVADRE